MINKNPYLIRLATSLSFDIPEAIVTKEKIMNYYIHSYQKNAWDNFTVNDIVKAAKMAGKKITGKSMLEVNVSLKDQLEFYNQTARLFNGRRNRYGVEKILEQNKVLLISSYLDNIPLKEIAESYNCSVVTLRRWLTKKGIRAKRTRNGKKILA